jgi:hypothetical protein
MITDVSLIDNSDGSIRDFFKSGNKADPVWEKVTFGCRYSYNLRLRTEAE